MAKADLPFDSTDYAPVAARITLFFERYPEGRIITELVSRSHEEITFKATVYRSEKLDVPAGTGWASERVGDGDVNTVACLENTETSAIGRALANIGFIASRNRPSAEEMAKASRERARAARERTRRSNPVSSQATAEVPGRSRPRVVREAAPAGSGAAAADVLADVRDLLDAAEREGMQPVRVQELRRELSQQEPINLPRITELEQALRRWLVRREARRRVADRGCTQPVSMP